MSAEREPSPAEREPRRDTVLRCDVCGREWPVYRIEAANHTPLGCEWCLIVRRKGVIQL